MNNYNASMSGAAGQALLTHYEKSIEATATTAEATLHEVVLGTGRDVLSEVFENILQNLNQELIFVTCFWARSESLDLFCRLLRSLSTQAVAAANRPKPRVRICFSSLSLMQKLFHTPSRSGQVYPPECWVKKFGLPSPAELKGLDLQVKSIFMAPFSVLHPKFIIVDRRMCFLPSCNVSWENWFEGCLQVQGPVVNCFVQFWEKIWCHGEQEGWDTTWSISPNPSSSSPVATLSMQTGLNTEGLKLAVLAHAPNQNDGHVNPATLLPLKLTFSESQLQSATFLPSQYHRNPNFRPFPWQQPPKCPQTPLNTSLLTIFREAQKSIFLQTPNITSPPVLCALSEALTRGIDITITTNERLMRIEQLVTAGTTTPQCVKMLIETRSRIACERSAHKSPRQIEEAASTVGCLRVYYFSESSVGQVAGSNSSPVSSHFKLTIVDENIVVLGSGNMDRASWYTSQELGIAIHSVTLAKVVFDAVCCVNSMHTTLVYNSGSEQM